MSRAELWCPVCENMVPHDRGYLKEHYTANTRGALTIGKRLCDGSNQKPPQDIRTVTFTGMCTHCVSTVRREFKETYPGSLDKYGGVMVVNCPECGDEGDYCKNCDHNLHREKVKVGAPVVPGNAQAELVQALQTMGMDQAAIDSFLATGSLPTTTPTTPGDLLSQIDTSGVTEAEVWMDNLREAECPDSEPHEQYHRERHDRPVTLTDNHVIKGNEEPEDMRDLGFRCSPDGPQRGQ